MSWEIQNLNKFASPKGKMRVNEVAVNRPCIPIPHVGRRRRFVCRYYDIIIYSCNGWQKNRISRASRLFYNIIILSTYFYLNDKFRSRWDTFARTSPRTIFAINTEEAYNNTNLWYFDSDAYANILLWIIALYRLCRFLSKYNTNIMLLRNASIPIQLYCVLRNNRDSIVFCEVIVIW